MKIKLWIANKLDRSNLHYRVVACILPRSYNLFSLFRLILVVLILLLKLEIVGSNGNYLMLPWDKEKGIKVFMIR